MIRMLDMLNYFIRSRIRVIQKTFIVIFVSGYLFSVGYSGQFEFHVFDIVIEQLFSSFISDVNFYFLRALIFGALGAITVIFLPYAIKNSLISRVFMDFFDVKQRDKESKAYNESSLYGIQRRLDELEAQATSGMAKSDYATLTDDVTKRVSASVDRSLLKTIEDKYGSRISEEQHLKAVDGGLSRLIDELARERSVVSTRSAINLIIGILIAGFGV